MAAKIVIDSSVLIKWVKTRNEELMKEARGLLSQVEKQALEVHVPSLLLYQIGNILLLKTQLDGTALDEALMHLEQFPFIVAPPAVPLLKQAARLSRRWSLTFYDASFLALAVELDCPFITATGDFLIVPVPCRKSVTFPTSALWLERAMFSSPCRW
jgi:predicted nucleic acid-binding protein